MDMLRIDDYKNLDITNDVINMFKMMFDCTA